MKTKAFLLRFSAASLIAALCVGDLTAELINVTDLKGRTIDIDLESVAGDSVTFKRSGKSFTLPLGNFDKASQKAIREAAAKIPATMPTIEPDIVIGKRRQKEGYYMEVQNITCTVKLTNSNFKVAVPPLTGKILMIGQDRRNTDVYTVLSAQSLNVSIEPGKTFVKEMKPVKTSYDSDNKGVGNIGGSQYFGFVLVLKNAAGEVVLNHTLTGGFRKALDEMPQLAEMLLTYSQDAELNDKLMRPSRGKGPANGLE